MIGWLLEAAVYAAIAGCVTAINWHRPTRLAGAALLVASLISSASFFFLPFELRVMRELAMAALITAVSATLWAESDADHPYRVVLILCLIDTALCGAIFLHGSSEQPIRSIFGWGVNIIFLGQCAAIATPGVRDAVDNWIRAIRDHRALDSERPDFDWLLGRLDDQ